MSPTPGLIAFIEGFSTLAVEVIAIRLAVPVVGSSMTLTGIMLGVVLFALSAGYWRGGMLSARWDESRVRTALGRNLFLAAVLYGAVAFPFEALLLERCLDAGWPLAAAIGVTAVLLVFLPVYLASQTVPMLAEISNTEGKAGQASGRVLFFSTMGSVVGGIVTPVWLFPSIGITRSGFVVCGLLAAIAGAIALGRLRPAKMLAAGTAALASIFAAHAAVTPSGDVFAFDSGYQSFRIVEEKQNGRTERILMLGGGRASGIYTDTGESSFTYIREAGKVLAETRAETVLAIGAAGFTFPRDAAQLDTVHRIDAVDVDPAVGEIAEHRFLKQPLPPKVRFLTLSARYAVRKLRKEGNRYGFTLIDAYHGQGIPVELVTAEFFQDVRQVSERTAVNVIMDRDIESVFASNLLATFRQAFGAVWVRDVRPGDSYYSNILVTSWPTPGAARWTGKGTLYRDDQNTADRDYVQLVWE